jgi:hypothetical protein
VIRESRAVEVAKHHTNGRSITDHAA